MKGGKVFSEKTKEEDVCDRISNSSCEFASEEQTCVTVQWTPPAFLQIPQEGTQGTSIPAAASLSIPWLVVWSDTEGYSSYV